MPAYELDLPDRADGLHRGRSAEDAVRRAADLPDAADLRVEDADGPDGWCSVWIDGEAAGRVRPHARMRFRRD